LTNLCRIITKKIMKQAKLLYQASVAIRSAQQDTTILRQLELYAFDDKKLQ